MTDAILTVNAGSSSLKLALFETAGGLRRVLNGAVSGIGEAAHFTAHDAAGKLLEDRAWPKGSATTHETCLGDVLEFMEAHLGDDTLLGIGHRVVHGGATHAGPAIITTALLAELRALTSLAPLHQPHNLAPIDAMRRLRPGLPQIACFDTAFHHFLPHLETRFALPREFAGEEVRRYGFHGLSYAHIAARLRELAPEIGVGRVIAAHLGAGASLCAMRSGVSVATTMGFTALDGLMMGTRCGAIDPGVLLYMLIEKHLSPETVQDLLYHQSGLLGVSGISGDMQRLRASNSPEAREAIDLFAYRIVRECGALVSVLGGLDGLVFTGGIGEHDAALRDSVCAGLAWLDVRIDGTKNRQGVANISTPDSKVSVFVLEADEEQTIAGETLSLLQGAK